ncbi:hypothetical protein [Selenomonas sp. AB3002]|uniref:hypothetical protein n=1 Tax=Selenomonas sp. AB3002 TaxID=1392502 RepID=UPI0016396ED9
MEYPKLMTRFIADNEHRGGRLLHVDRWKGTNCIKHTAVIDKAMALRDGGENA